MGHHRFGGFRRVLVAAGAVGLLLGTLTTTEASAPAPQASLDMYTATVDRATEGG